MKVAWEMVCSAITHGQLLLSENWIDNVSKFRMEKQQLACVSYGVSSERIGEK